MVLADYIGVLGYVFYVYGDVLYVRVFYLDILVCGCIDLSSRHHHHYGQADWPPCCAVVVNREEVEAYLISIDLRVGHIYLLINYISIYLNQDT